LASTLLASGCVLVAAAIIAAVGWAIIQKLNRLIERETTVAETLQELDAVIAGLGTGIAQLITDTNALIAAVQAIPGQDFTNEVNAINADIASLQSLDTSVTTETGQLGGASGQTPTAGAGETIVSHPVTGAPTVVPVDPVTGAADTSGLK
jgi:uncharacterized protein YoxC